MTGVGGCIMEIVSIVGSGCSGSGAVMEYLIGREDVHVPMPEQEFRLLQEPGGMSDLYGAISLEYHPNRAKFALINFIKLARRLGETSKKIRIPPRLGYGFSERLPGYEKKLNLFINKITATKIRSYSLIDKLQFSTIDWILKKMGFNPISSNLNHKKPIPVPKEEFLNHAENFLNRLFITDEKYDLKGKEITVLDQAGSFWSPLSSTRYFGEARKIIVVTRHPRDMYAQSIRNKRNKLKFQTRPNVKKRIKVHNAVMKNINQEEWNSKKVLVVSFESFVKNHQEERKRLCRFLKINPEIPSPYNPKESGKNVDIYKEYLTEKEKNIFTHETLWPLKK